MQRKKKKKKKKRKNFFLEKIANEEDALNILF